MAPMKTMFVNADSYVPDILNKEDLFQVIYTGIAEVRK